MILSETRTHIQAFSVVQLKFMIETNTIPDSIYGQEIITEHSITPTSSPTSRSNPFSPCSASSFCTSESSISSSSTGIVQWKYTPKKDINNQPRNMECSVDYSLLSPKKHKTMEKKRKNLGKMGKFVKSCAKLFTLFNKKNGDRKKRKKRNTPTKFRKYRKKSRSKDLPDY